MCDWSSDVCSSDLGLLYQEAMENYDQRHRMKPGITGLAQVSGWRGETAAVEQIEQRVRHDLYYIDNWSILMDAKIILRTMTTGFTGANAYLTDQPANQLVAVPISVSDPGLPIVRASCRLSFCQSV